MIDILVAAIGAMQIITVAYLEHSRRVSKKMCGNPQCVAAIKKALNVHNVNENFPGVNENFPGGYDYTEPA